jgi:DNA-binding response OmpR family regulator
MKTILLVEDDQDVANLARHWLEREGYAVVHAPDGAAALAVLGQGAGLLPQLVLLDVMLPKMDGFELLKRIRADEHTRALPVIMVTSFTRDKDVERGRRLGANDYIVKPLAEVDFLERVARLLRKP